MNIALALVFCCLVAYAASLFTDRYNVHKVFWTERIVVTSIAVALFLMIGVALSGWYVGSRGVMASGGNTTSPGSALSGTQSLVQTQTSDVDLLRAEGWTLPLVGLTGYSTESLRHTTVAGQPALSIAVEYNGTRRITVVEQRGHIDTKHPVAGDTNLPASAVGLEPKTIAGSTVWVHEGSPWRAMIVHEDVSYTVVSDAAPATMADLLQQIEAGHNAALEQPARTNKGTLETIALGWRRILGMQ